MGRKHYRKKAVKDRENQKQWENFLNGFNARLEARRQRRVEKIVEEEEPVIEKASLFKRFLRWIRGVIFCHILTQTKK